MFVLPLWLHNQDAVILICNENLVRFSSDPYGQSANTLLRFIPFKVFCSNDDPRVVFTVLLKGQICLIFHLYGNT